MIHNFDTMRELVEKLNYYTKLYDEGTPAISDKEWDDMYFQLQELEKESGVILSNSPSLEISYTVKNSLEKVKHNHPMLSLQKTKSEEEVVNFIKGYDTIVMAKMDGLTCSLLYRDGVLVSAETRGNGIIGENITHNMLWVQNVPLDIPIKDEIIIDGEIICTYKNFEQFSDKFANPRNFAAGSIRLLDAAECAARKLTFIAWDCIKGLDDKEKLSDKLYELNNLGFEIVPYIPLQKDMIDIDHIKHCNVLIQHWVKDPDFLYPIDGTVYKFDDCKYYSSLGRTDHHFRGGIAFKFYDETYSTILRGVDWTMGRTGQLTPTAVFESIEIDGTIVERASLHNVSVMHDTLGPCAYKDEPLEIYKANQIIPQVYSAGPYKTLDEIYAENKILVDQITTCPICGEPVEFKQDGIATICYCTNPNCDGKIINQFEHFCGKKGLDIKGLSKATLEKLLDWEWLQDFDSVFTLKDHRSEWIKKPGFGVASVDKILNSIENSKNTELWRIVAAAGIPEIGITASKTIANYYKTWEAFREAIDQNVDFSHLPDFGYVMDKNIRNYNFTIMDKVVKYLNYAAAAAPAQTGLDGLQFCITGKVTQWKNRDVLKEYIESLGGKVTGSVTSKTNYLINNDTESTTQKNVTAKKLGIPILSEKDFAALIAELLDK